MLAVLKYKVRRTSTPVYLHRRIIEHVCSRTLHSSAIPLLDQWFTRTHISRHVFSFSAPSETCCHKQFSSATLCLFLNPDLNFFCSIRVLLNSDPTCRKHLWSYDHMMLQKFDYYAALLPRRGPHIALHSVCPSVCPSVPLSLPSVTSRHLANYNDTHVLFGARWGPHIVRPSRPHKFLLLLFLYPQYYRSRGLKAKQVKKAGRPKVRVDITFKRLMQQDSVESLQSDRESLEEELFLLDIIEIHHYHCQRDK